MAKILYGRILIVRLIMLTAMVALITIGLLSIYASGHPVNQQGGEIQSPFAGQWKSQLLYAGVGLAAFLAINYVDYRWLGPFSYWIYAAILVILAVILLDKVIDLPFVPVINGARRWIWIGWNEKVIAIQPSEFCKIAYILALAWYLRFRKNYRKFKGLIGPFALTLLAMVLILLEPDLGTVLLMMPILFSMLFVAGAKVKHLLIIIMLAVLISPVMWKYMNDYQRRRISSVLLQNEWIRNQASNHPKISQILTGKERFDESRWTRGSGWQLKNSKYAIASGGLKGYGYRRGPYIEGPYLTYNLPERHNDFIFAIIAHQWGFFGCLTVLAIYAVIVACGMEIAWLNTDAYGRLISVGIVSMFVVEVIVNVSMTVGLMPITGLTLPFISRGGSSLVVSMIGVGLLNNIGKYRPFSVAGKAFEYKT